MEINVRINTEAYIANLLLIRYHGEGMLGSKPDALTYRLVLK
jgi:hypothetical protein